MESFSHAFEDCVSGCRRTCNCETEFYDPTGERDWEDGELEALEADSKAIALNHSVGTLRFGGDEYVIDCDCWKEKAESWIAVFESHRMQIADFFGREKTKALERAQAMADLVPESFAPTPDWKPMDSAPMNSTRVNLMMKNGAVVYGAHWACDESGEEQPPFRGWFIRDEKARCFKEVEGKPYWWQEA